MWDFGRIAGTQASVGDWTVKKTQDRQAPGGGALVESTAAGMGTSWGLVEAGSG